MFHRHKWKVVSKEEKPSEYDVFTEHATSAKMKRTPPDFFRRYVIVHYRCECGSEKVVRV